MFYVLVSGKRNFDDYHAFKQFMDDSLQEVKDDIEIIAGEARGADYLAKIYASEKGYSYKGFPAYWEKFGNAAGPIRNSEMINYIKEKNGKAVFFLDGMSKGTGDCLRKARSCGIMCEICNIEINDLEQEKIGDVYRPRRSSR